MKKFSIAWKASNKPGKQRKHRSNSPLSVKHKFMQAHLSKELRQKYGKRSMGLRKGDRVKVMAGKFKKHEGRVEGARLRKISVLVSGAEITKKDGTKKLVALHPSNLMITELNLDDKFRQKLLERK